MFISAYVNKQEPSAGFMHDPTVHKRKCFLRLLLELLNAFVSKFLSQGGVEPTSPRELVYRQSLCRSVAPDGAF